MDILALYQERVRNKDLYWTIISVKTIISLKTYIKRSDSHYVKICKTFKSQTFAVFSAHKDYVFLRNILQNLNLLEQIPLAAQKRKKIASIFRVY